MNILILSAGSRNKIVQYFKKTLDSNGRVIATDCSNLAPAIYDADFFYIVPRINAPNYLDVILDICTKEKIDGVLSLIDPELSLISKEKDKFLAIGCTPIVSDYDIVETCFDKFKMFNLLKRFNFPTAQCFMDIDDFYRSKEEGLINYPVFVKPATGSASININKVTTDEELNVLFSQYDNLMIQEFMNGSEIGVDMYIDMLSGEVTSIFAKEKIKMRAGETDKAISIKDQKLFDLLINFADKCHFKGMIDIDIFKIDDTYYISEVNPRFGGGYPHAYECGVDMMSSILNNLNGIINPITLGEYETNICMMKYNEVLIKKL